MTKHEFKVCDIKFEWGNKLPFRGESGYYFEQIYLIASLDGPITSQEGV